MSRKGKKVSIIGRMTGMELVRYQAGKMHHEMGGAARRGSGTWSTDKDYDRRNFKGEARRIMGSGREGGDEPDHGRDS